MSLRPGTIAACLIALPGLAAAQAKAPATQFWMDVATHNMAVPGMEEAGDMGMLGNMFGGTRMTGGMPGKWLDTALFTRNKPEGTEGSHAIPADMRMGSSLPLLPVKATRETASEGDGQWEKPKGKLHFYWGCGENVRPGQPRTIDFAKADSAEYARFVTGRFAPDRGAKAVPGRSVWPNEKNRQRVPKDASLVGDHAISGEGVPPSLRFALASGYDFMPRIQMGTRGDPKDSVAVDWQPVANARGYFLTAMGSRGEYDMVIWSSSEQPEPGWGLMDYVAPAQVDKLINDKVVLPKSAQRCAIPKGIFANAEGAMVRMIAYGPELNLAHPPKPSDPKAPWNPEWSARVRVKSTAMAFLGMEEGDGGRSGRGTESAAPRQEEVDQPLINPINVIRGIFGR